MGKNKLDIINFSKLYDMFGEKAAKDVWADVNKGKNTREELEEASK